ncbi:unnamed protein product [Didymodactylos carnosus]|uniref:Cleavage and polyadenylation specificity factor subunit 6 n=1 Tax=Didymodactylos carnosus TaxID=1234261 RepID=A0A8S2GFX5_9BILA|nr:unnamed protein product [Didymodactylos carnosus]CAF3514174.1 unnamed protein product [Didymodactylos carnosus]
MEGDIAGNDTEIDLYADVVENDLEQEPGEEYGQEDLQQQDGDLYDAVITAQPSGVDFNDITNTPNRINKTPIDMPAGAPSSYTGKRVSLYVGQLTWWTTDQDLSDIIQLLGINDLLEIKFHENRVNGQSKGFAVVTVGSENSSRIIGEKLPKKDIHGQNPTVLPCNKQSLSFFEGQNHKDQPIEGLSSMTPPQFLVRPPMIRPPIHGLPLPMPRPMGEPYRFHPQGPPMGVGLPPQPGLRPPMQLPHQVRPPQQMLVGRQGMPIPNPQQGGAPPTHQQVVIMQQQQAQQQQQQQQQIQRPGLPSTEQGANGPPLPVPRPQLQAALRPQGIPMPQQSERTQREWDGRPQPGVPVPSNSMTGISHHPQGYYPGQNPAVGAPLHHSLPHPGQPHVHDPYYRAVAAAAERHDPNMPGISISETEFQEIMERNKTVSSSAIARAVQDASAGEFGTAIETLVTAVSLIKQSKIANDDRCKILISSLQDTLKGIEDKSYGQRARHRSRSHDSPRESSRKKHRHRTRSPRDREYRREDYDAKYSREHRRR